MHTFLPYAFLKGAFVEFEKATLSVATHALHYGTAAFGGMRGIPDPHNPRQILLFRADRHAQRLSRSARFLKYDLEAGEILKNLEAFVRKNAPATPFYLRPLVYTSDLGISPRLHNVEKDLLIYGIELGDYLSPEGVSCRISSWYRQEDRSFPLRGKISGGYITSSMAKTEAVESGFDEAIMMNSQGKVCEASGMNIFVVRDGVIVTPGVDQDILEGITRDSVITVARDMGYQVIERPVDKSELLIADEVFLSGTAAKVTPVKQIENYPLPKERPVTNALKDAITAITENREPRYSSWVHPIPLD
ncbi:branched chain amino acid aminotransferase [Alkalispirochaeta sphaeroplastigenens]|uniref:Branched-chain-amino-acid aminotransferase n=1 Tax=Alkalispirochaeta sphaeroplastigenens TaxID=1187066 RepID=A0A2S4JSV8_9SPIO|nr:MULTISPECIES: branched-chain amino acid transaminase [Alkalispirochaeta]POR02624.1 branched chain amino acid aminotransferase [Alkalispirochaeta sphaeroplastigenens]